MTNKGIYNPDIEILVLHPVNPETLYASTTAGRVYQSHDHGDSWLELGIDLTGSDILTLHIDRRSPDLLYVGTRLDGLIVINTRE